MRYSDFTIDMLKERFGLRFIEDTALFAVPPSFPVPASLRELLRRYLPLATLINTEKSRSELIIAPVLVEFKLHAQKHISLFSGTDFSVDPQAGLSGRCDYIISLSPEQLLLSAPIIIIVEAKNENIVGGIPQCIAGMVAAMRFNERKNNPIECIYGIVTTGSLWRFLKLEADLRTFVDTTEYHIQQLETLLGVLDTIIMEPATPAEGAIARWAKPTQK